MISFIDAPVGSQRLRGSRPLGRLQRRALRAGLAVLIGVSAPALAVAVGSPAQAQPTGGNAVIQVSSAAAAAENILNVIQNGDAKARYAIFSDELKAVTSPALVARAMARQPKVLSWRITSVDAGLEHATVDALLQTSRGPQSVVLIIDDMGKLEAYQVDSAATPTTKVARDFITAVSKDQWVQARSFLSLGLQEEIPPGSLQAKWLGLQRQTGKFVKVRSIIEAQRNMNSRVVLVTMEFSRLNDTLLVIFDDRNQITGLDFPAEPATIAKPR